MQEVKAKKFLGQHFLCDEQIAYDIVAALSNTTTQVMEIGPGTGILTKYLLNKDFKQLIAVELDRDSVSYLKSKYPSLKLIEADVLHLDYTQFFDRQFAIIGNFPYNISSQILFSVLEHRHQINEVVGMLQREVAIRIASPAGNRDYGILSVMLQAFYHIELLFTVDEQVFSPPPKVKSAVIKMVRNQITQLDCDEPLFFKVIKTAFNQRRKTLHNALKPITDYQGEFAGKRAEQLNVQQFIQLTNEIKNHLIS